jgi:hypothetical protein
MMKGAGIRQLKMADYFKVKPTALNKALKRLEKRWENGKGSKEKLMGWAKVL